MKQQTKAQNKRGFQGLRVLRHGQRTQSVSQALVEGLLSSGLKPGDKIPTENEMCKLYSVSRPTVRQALKSLEVLGLVESKPRRGTILKEANLGALMPYFKLHLSLKTVSGNGESPLSLDMMAEARCILESAVIPLSAQRRTKADLTRIEKAEKEFADVADTGDLKRRRMADAAFHRSLMMAAHNPFLEGITELIDAYFQTRNLSHPERSQPIEIFKKETQKTIDEHHQVVDAIKQKDAKKVGQLMYSQLSKLSTTLKKR
jgi:GntR family transcriptional regulator, transcriptional repressor for pyruvate dehydrogenase complex